EFHVTGVQTCALPIYGRDADDRHDRDEDDQGERLWRVVEGRRLVEPVPQTRAGGDHLAEDGTDQRGSRLNPQRREDGGDRRRQETGRASCRGGGATRG